MHRKRNVYAFRLSMQRSVAFGIFGQQAPQLPARGHPHRRLPLRGGQLQRDALQILHCPPDSLHIRGKFCLWRHRHPPCFHSPNTLFDHYWSSLAQVLTSPSAQFSWNLESHPHLTLQAEQYSKKETTIPRRPPRFWCPTRMSRPHLIVFSAPIHCLHSKKLDHVSGGFVAFVGAPWRAKAIWWRSSESFEMRAASWTCTVQTIRDQHPQFLKTGNYARIERKYFMISNFIRASWPSLSTWFFI